jgi:excisionase family DNA binding protein
MDQPGEGKGAQTREPEALSKAPTAPPTHYEPSGFVPEPPVFDQRAKLRWRALSRPSGRPILARLRRAEAACKEGRKGSDLRLLGAKPWPMQTPLTLDRGGMERKSSKRSFFTERTLADFLAVSDRTIRNWIRRGELPSYKLGAARRIDPADVEDFLARHRDEAS